MAKILKILAKTIGGVLEWTLILIIFLAFAIRTSSFQTYLAEKATAYLSDELDTEFRVGKVDIYFFDRLSLDDVFVRDQNGDTLAALHSVDVVLQSFNPAKNKVVLKNIALNRGRVGISRDSIKGDYNYWFITDYFSSGKKTSKSKPADVTVKSLDIDAVDITYDDYRKSYSEYGMDFDHLDLKDVLMHANSFESDGSTFAFNLERLSARESCGFNLRRLKAHCLIGDQGILLNEVRINTSRSRIYAHKFNLRMSGLKDMHSFVDSVRFDAEIDSSAVSMRDVSFFAPALKGMHQKVYLRAGLSKRVKDLKITDIDLRTGKRSIIRGDLVLPDFRDLESAFLDESIDYAFLDMEDVESFRLPDRAKDPFLKFDPMVQRLGYFEVKNLDIVGYLSQFVLSSHDLSTRLGTVHLDNGLLFTALNEGGYEFERSANSTYDVAVDSFNLGKFIDNPLFGDVRGKLFLGGVVGQKDVIRLHKLDGKLTRFGFNSYTYSNIEVSEGAYKNKIFDAEIRVDDPHLQLDYAGKIDLNDGQNLNFSVDVKNADLGKLHFTNNLTTHLKTNFKIDITGTNLSNYNGVVDLNGLNYREDSNKIDIPKLVFRLERGANKDEFTVTSDVADAHVKGKVDPLTLAQSINNLLAKPLPAYFQYQAFPKKVKDDDFFDLDLTVKEAKEVLRIFVPELEISNQTKLAFHYNAQAGEQTISLKTPEGGFIMYDSIIAKGFDLEQSLLAGKVQTNLKIDRFSISDSLFVNNLDYDVSGTGDNFGSVLKWNQGSDDPAHFIWGTALGENGRVAVRLRPSYFSVKHQLWEIQNTSFLTYEENKLVIDHLVIERDAQFIAINGVLSDSKDDEVLVNLRDIHLEEFSSFIDAETAINGSLSGDVQISTPFTSARAEGDLKIRGLEIEQQAIGDVSVGGIWDATESRMIMNGTLHYAMSNEDAFDFYGFYYPYRTGNNLDLDLDFNNMDIQFANAFVDPTVLSNIRGKLKGKIDITGSLSSPQIDGKLNLSNGNVKVGLLGVSYKLSGPIRFSGANSGFYIDNMPVIDEEFNKAFLTAAISHENFTNWNSDININMEDDYSRRDPSGFPLPVERFLVLNTQYKEGDIYYGKAYVNGTANIFLTDNNVAINVDVATRRDTKIVLPMYGNSELEAGKFIVIHDPNKKDKDSVKPKLDLTGLDLNLQFDITPDAEVKLIFNDKTEDMIVAHGAGPLNITLDNLDNLSMTGRYEIVGKEGNYYNFVMGPIKQIFKIKEGGTITWVEDPYNAKLNLEAYNPVKANINEIAPDLASDNASSGNKDIQCLMRITESLYEPKIELDLDAPAATESERAILNEVRSKPEELQKQFFSLLLFKKFVPLAGHTTVGTGGLADVLMQQLNGILSGLSDEVKLKLGYDDDNTTGNKSYTLGLERQFGSWVVKGQFGVANTTESSGNAQSNLIGDMSLEYLINEDGSFRVNIFNESNDNSAIQDKTQGLFTQGVGLHYQEEFNSIEDFKMVQIPLDLVRKEKRIKIKKRRKEVSVEEPLETKPLEEPKKEETPPVTPPPPPVGNTVPGTHDDSEEED